MNNDMSNAQHSAAASESQTAVEEMAQQVIDAVANFGAETVIRALSDACSIAASVHEELKDWSRMSELLHYAKSLEQMPLSHK